MSFSVESSDNVEARTPLLGARYEDEVSVQSSGNGVCVSVCEALLNTWKFILDRVKSVCSRVAAFFASLLPSKRVTVSVLQEERLRDLWLRIQTSFDEANPEHVVVLQEIWKAGFPEIEWMGQKSKQWSKMGWQGMDPVTDLRGGGFLALECLLYLSQKNPSLFYQLMNKTEGVRAEWEYPFAAAGVNITFTLIEMFQLRNIEDTTSTPQFKTFLNLLDDGEHSFEELYCVMFVILDKNWLDLKASYMEFPVVMKKTRHQMEDALATSPNDIQDVKRILGL